MIARIILWSVANKLFVVLGALALVAAGGASAVREHPEATRPRVRAATIRVPERR